jgi:hypothetical protein
LTAILFFLFSFHQTSAQVVINEIHYDPDLATNLVEFVELYNAGIETVDLSGWSLRDGIAYQFPDQTVLPADAYLVIAQNVNAVAIKYSISRALILGPFAGRLDNDGERIELTAADGRVIDRVEYALGFPWPTVGDPVSASQPGSGYSIQLVNPTFDNDLGGSWRSNPPTPAKRNVGYAENIPPHIRQVRHKPEQPRSHQTVTITAKVTDPDGVRSVILHYQAVDAGQYIHLNDAAYRSNWTDLPMRDDGSAGDAIAGDSIYTVQLPANLQVHRRLMRYRITVTDSGGYSLKVPYTDDPQPNFAYFVYDGVPEWVGAVRPGVTPDVTYRTDVLSSLPVYHLITSKSEAEKCTWLDQFMHNEYVYTGTLVYGAQVFDHVWFRARGGTWRYAMGKNMWKFNFNRGHALQAHDNFGRPYDVKWDKLNLGANIQQRDYWHRGEQGMFESVGFKLFNLAGLESCHTNFVHFRIIDEEHEDGRLNAAHPPLTSSGTQYDGDFWGLYLATEQPDRRFLKEHGLPDGNLYKMENGTGEIRNQSPTGAIDKSDLNDFMRNYSQRPSEQWWRQNVDLERYYNYLCIVEAIHQYDISYGKNYYYFLNPETNRWHQIAWDLDLTWADNMFGSGQDPFKQAGILNHEGIRIEFQSRLREIRDLLYNSDQTNQLIDEYAAFIFNPNDQSFVDADRAMWDYHWVMSDQARRQGYKNRDGKSGQGEFYKIAPTKDFAGMVKIMKDYVVSRGQWIDRTYLNDANIPATPTLVAAASNDFSREALTFQCSPFSDPQGNNTFAAMKWRIAEVDPDSRPVTQTPSNEQILIPASSRWNYFKGREEPSTPRSAWRLESFDDSGWLEGSMPIGYGENFLSTTLSDMRNNYTTFYVRKVFEVEIPADIGRLTAQVAFDDGFNMWINGVHVASDSVTSDELPYNAVSLQRADNNNYIEYRLPDPSRYLVVGRNVIALQVLNVNLGSSSDCFVDVRLVATLGDDDPDAGSEGTGFRKRTQPGKLEIHPLWESEELTAFQNQITIPPAVVTAGHTYRVRVRMKDNTGRWSHWSAPVQFDARESENTLALLDHLRVTELMYNPLDGNQFEFVELHNTHPSALLTLDGVCFANGIDFTFAEGTVIPPGGYLLVTPAGTESEKAAFRAQYGLDSFVSLVGPYSGKLANEGEQITLKLSRDGQDILSFEYGDGMGWPQAVDGAGHSLVPLDAAVAGEGNGSLYYGGNWRASAFRNGSPGRADPPPIRNVVLNEFMANTSLQDSTQNGSDSGDWIEIYNTAHSIVNLGGWYLSDDADDLRKWALPSMDIGTNERISFDEVHDFNQAGMNGFALSKDGERLFLSYLPGVAGVDRVVDAVRFKGQEVNLSYARTVDGDAFWIAAHPTRDLPNRPDYRRLVIDEMMYHPPQNEESTYDRANHEYLELFNPTAAAVDLWNELGAWRLDGGVDYVFPAGTSIPANGRLLIVGFDPLESTLLDGFVQIYGINRNDVQISGPYAGKLSNRGERIAVEKPLSVDLAAGAISWIIVDEVIYFHQTPWPSEADGTGMSLQRISTARSGNDPANWKAEDPTVGKPGSPDTFVGGWMIY